MMLRRSLVLISLTGGAAVIVTAIAGGCSSFSEPEEGAEDTGVVETGSPDVVVADSPSADVATSDADADGGHFCDRYPDASEMLCADFDEGEVANYGLGVPSPAAPTVDLGKALSLPGSMRVDDEVGTKVSFITITSPKPVDAASSPKRRLSFDLFVDSVTVAKDGSGPYLAGLRVGDCVLDLEQFQSYARLVLAFPSNAPMTIPLTTAAPGGWRHFVFDIEDSLMRYAVTAQVDGKKFPYTQAPVSCANLSALPVTAYVGIGKSAGGVVAHYDNVVFETPP